MRKVVIVGAGPGGYVCALRLAQLGAKVTIVEKNNCGGTCLNVGCIPSKALIEVASAIRQMQNTEGLKAKVTVGDIQGRKKQVVEALTSGVQGLLEKAGVQLVMGEARLVKGEVRVGSKPLKADAVVLATGSTQADLPGLKIDHKFVIDSTDALRIAPPKAIAIVGGGVIGVELGYYFNALGTKVHIVEKFDRLVFHEDEEMSAELFRYLKRQGIMMHFKTDIKELSPGKMVIESGEKSTLVVNKVLVAVGRRPVTKWLEGEVALERGFVKVNRYLETSVKKVYAIGDVVFGPMLAHRASHQGVMVAEHIMKHSSPEKPVVAGAIYTEPQIASVGMTEEGAKEAKIPYKVGKFRFIANGKAKCAGHTDGLVKVLAHKGRLIGAHIIGSHASEMIHMLVLAVQEKIPVKNLQRMVFIHPTMSEAIGEALLDLESRALHM